MKGKRKGQENRKRTRILDIISKTKRNFLVKMKGKWEIKKDRGKEKENTKERKMIGTLKQEKRKIRGKTKRKMERKCKI